MRQGALGLIGVGVGVVLAFACPAAAGADAGQLKAGVAVVDATWHVGASAGQYATTRDADGADQFDDFDPGCTPTRTSPPTACSRGWRPGRS